MMEHKSMIIIQRKRYLSKTNEEAKSSCTNSINYKQVYIWVIFKL